jgi:ketosteroid isomerase-like protein
MKKLLLLIIPALLACNPVDLRTKAIEDILATDKAMSKEALEKGFNQALAGNADDAFVKLGNGSYPITGKLDFIERMREKPVIKTISWEPEDAEASKAGDLGYSWGNWKFVAEDTTYYGNYVTVWKKDTDGKWKMLLDGGNDTPAPMK